MRMPREWYIPKNAAKVSDKRSSAVAYLYQNVHGKPCVAVFAGKRAKPDNKYQFKTEETRAAYVAKYFEAVQADAERKASYRAERTAAPRGLDVGNIVNTCWGYDQTNREFYQVTKMIGRTMVEVREISQTRDVVGWEQWKAGGVKDKFIGDPIRCVARNGGCKVDDHHASLWSGTPCHASGYA